MSTPTFSNASHAAPRAAAVTRQRGKVPTRNALLKIAANTDNFEYKTSARHALQHAGFASTPKFIDELIAAAKFIVANRKSRKERIILARVGVPKNYFQTGPRRQAVLLPNGTPEQRLQMVRTRAVTGDGPISVAPWRLGWAHHAGHRDVGRIEGELHRSDVPKQQHLRGCV